MQGQLFDVGPDPNAEQPVDVIGVCHRCGARTEPCPSFGVARKDGWWEGVAFVLIALKAHEPECPGAVAA